MDIIIIIIIIRIFFNNKLTNATMCTISDRQTDGHPSDADGSSISACLACCVYYCVAKKSKRHSTLIALSLYYKML